MDGTTPRWGERLAIARSLVADAAAARPWIATLVARLDDLELSLVAAEADRRRITEAIDRLQPERAARELKDALRRQARGEQIDDAIVETLRRRHTTIHQLTDRAEQIVVRIDAAVADAEHIAARAVELALGHGPGAIEPEIARLEQDLLALELARAELEGI